MGQATTENREPRGVVAVGASAGGVEALANFVAGLPRDLPYAVLAVLHMPRHAPSVLAKILDRSGVLPAAAASPRQRLEARRIYVAVPDLHLLVADHRIVLSHGPTENGYRPAINSLFRSVALAYGPRAVGVLLSGVLDDGVLGLSAIRSRAGTTIVQEPSDALFPNMPHSAIEAGVADHRAAAGEVGSLLMQLAARDIKDKEMKRDMNMELENRIAMANRFSTSFESEELGPPSGFICPDCNGSLQSVGEGNFRCRVGHAWTAEALLRARDGEFESALWIALRSLQEKAKLARRMADNVGPGVLYEKYTQQAEEAETALTVLGERLSVAYQDEDARGAV
jgi:two-component system, chemotaxis family, protein-glutamate methylesterase/glutaminase